MNNKQDATSRVSQEALRAIALAQTTAPPDGNRRMMVLGLMLNATLHALPELTNKLAAQTEENGPSVFAENLSKIHGKLVDHFHHNAIIAGEIPRTMQLLETLQAHLVQSSSLNTGDDTMLAKSIIRASLDFERAAVMPVISGNTRRYAANPLTTLAIMNEGIMPLLPKIGAAYPLVAEKAGNSGWNNAADPALRSLYCVEDTSMESASAESVNTACTHLAKLVEDADKVLDASYRSDELFTMLRTLRCIAAPYKAQTPKPMRWGIDNVVRPDFGAPRGAQPTP